MLNQSSIKIIALILILSSAIVANAQSTAFTYQGKLNDGGIPANGTYQFQFKLFDAATNGNQKGQVLNDIPVTVSNGIFAVSLDFGANSFDGGARFLEISVRLDNSGLGYTTLNPRHAIASTPYAIKSLNAEQAATAINTTNLGGVPAAQYVQTTDSRMTDSRQPAPGSGNYIQNTQSQQSSSNFNISGEGKANKFNAATQYDINGNRVLSVTGTDNVFVGADTGNVNTGGYNAFVGKESGKSNTAGFNNSFLGAYSGRSNTSGKNNAFVGANAGMSNNIGSSNAFFGSNAGTSNTSGESNSFFGNSSGQNNSIGINNSYFGRSAGAAVTSAGNNAMFGAYAGENTTTGGNAYFGTFAGQKNTVGFSNTFVGLNAGKENTGGNYNTFIGANSGQNIGASGNNNTAIGYNAKVGVNVTNAMAIGANATANQNNAIVLGTNTNNVSIPGALEVSKQAKFSDGAIISGSLGTGAITATSLKVSATYGEFTVEKDQYGYLKTKIGGGLEVESNISANGATFGTTKVYTLGFKSLGGGSNEKLCYLDTDPYTPLSNKSMSKCSSSRRYKENIQDFTSGLNLLNRLRPVSYRWKTNGQNDLGFIAEEVNEVEPLLSTYNEKGEVEGVKYELVTTVLVNSIKEQQEQIKQQQAQIEALKALVCDNNKRAAICQK